MFSTGVLLQMMLELGDFLAFNESGSVNHLLNTCVYILLDFRVL